MADTKLISVDLLRLLAKKHDDDIFIPECKNGPTHTASHRRFDAWVMKKSWSKPLTIGYEIKVSRNDFLRDNKWDEYLPYCHELYFVTPWQMVTVEEVPHDAGLIWTSKTGSRLFTKKKAPRRNVEIPDEIYRYVLMSRANIVDNAYRYTYENRREYWAKWLEDKKLDWEFGHHVSKAIKETIKNEIEKVKRENADLIEQISEYRDLSLRLEELGFPVNQHVSTWQVKNKLTELKEGVSRGQINRVREGLLEVSKFLEELEAK